MALQDLIDGAIGIIVILGFGYLIWYKIESKHPGFTERLKSKFKKKDGELNDNDKQQLFPEKRAGL